MPRLLLILIVTLYTTVLFGFNLDCYSFPNVNTPLSIPTYIPDSDETCHPDVLYFPDGWNGWQYWMSHTPYPDTNVQYENPSIVVSNDGINWVEPSGLINPVADVYDGTDWYNNYNSDSHLYMSPDNSTMNLIWRRKNGWNNELIKRRSSTDGINWTTPEIILSVFGTTPELNESVLSPCMLYNGHRYMLWTVNTKVNPRSVYLRFKDFSDESFGDTILTDIGEFPQGYRLWHMDVEYFDGYYHMLASVGNPSNQDGIDLYLGKSLNGINWTFSSAPVMMGRQGFWDALLYRPALLPQYIDGILHYRNWYGSMNTPDWRIGYTESQVGDYLPSPIDFQVMHHYDGQNHFQLSWQAPERPVTGYKVYLNHQEYQTLDPETTALSLTVSEGAPHEGLVAFAVFAVYPEGSSDPVVSRSDLAIANSDALSPQAQPCRLYPNPFGDTLYLESAAKGSFEALELYNMRGQLVFSRVIDSSFDGTIEVESSLSRGVYLYKLSGKSIVQSGRLIKL